MQQSLRREYFQKSNGKTILPCDAFPRQRRMRALDGPDCGVWFCSRRTGAAP